MALTDLIFSEYFDDQGNISDSKRNEFIDKVNDNLTKGSGKFISFFKDKLGLEDEVINQILPDFAGDPSYLSQDLNLKDKTKFAEFHSDYIDGYLKTILTPLNLPAQTPLLALGIFDPTGLLPDFEQIIQNKIIQNLPPELKDIQLKMPLTLIQMAILGGITEEQIQPLFSELNITNTSLSELKSLSTNELVNLLKTRIPNPPQEFSQIQDSEKFVKLLFGTIKEEEIPNVNIEDLRKKAKEKLQDTLISKFREKLFEFVSPEILLQTFPFPPPLPIPPVTIPFDITTKITSLIETFKNLIPIPSIPIEVLDNGKNLFDTIQKNKQKIDDDIQKITGKTNISATQILSDQYLFKIASNVVPLNKIDTQPYVDKIKLDIEEIIKEKTSKYTKILEIPLQLIGTLFSKIDTLLSFVTDFFSAGIKGLLKNFFTLISGIIAPIFAEKGQTINSLKDLSPFQFAVAIVLITTLISAILSLIVGSIFGKGEIVKSIINFFN